MIRFGALGGLRPIGVGTPVAKCHRCSDQNPTANPGTKRRKFVAFARMPRLVSSFNMESILHGLLPHAAARVKVRVVGRVPPPCVIPGWAFGKQARIAFLVPTFFDEGDQELLYYVWLRFPDLGLGSASLSILRRRLALHRPR